MFALALGIAVGLLALMPIGPLSMTIIGVGVEHGPHRGIQAALGVVGADVVLGAVALTMVSVGTVLPGSVFTGLQWVSAVMVVGFGAAVLLRARQLRGLVGRVRRPTITLFVMTAASPAIGTWVALLLASPFTGRARSLSAFAVGILVASLIWHPALGAGAGLFGPRLSERRLLWIARIGGASMAAMGVGLLVV